MQQEIDWEYLKSQDYAITFTVKADKPACFDVRLVNREDAVGIPWRLYERVEIESDGQWHTVRIPLASMREHGAWDSAAEKWLIPEGKFSWDNIVTLAFAAEETDLHGITILFDSIKLENTGK